MYIATTKDYYYYAYKQALRYSGHRRRGSVTVHVESLQHSTCYARVIIMVDLWNRADHYIFMLWFVLLSFFFSSPNLSRRRLDVCHTSTHGVALVRI